MIKFSIGGTSSKNIKSIITQNKQCIQAWKDNGMTPPFYYLIAKVLRKFTQFIR